MNSSLFVGRVSHTRLRPFRHHFEYRVFYGLFDVDELADLERRLRLFSMDRFNLFSFRASDHGPADGSALRPWVESVLAHAGIDLGGGRIELLAYPRILGYVFNPISIWYCYSADDELRAVLHEVRNTFGDRHVYVVPVEPDDLRHEFDKKLHVSPFMDMDSRYRFTITRPGRRLAVAIEQEDAEGPLFRAGLAGSRTTFTDRNLIRLFMTHPLLTLKVIGGIHWQAFRLWRKGAGYRPRPQPLPETVTIVTAERGVV